MLIFRKLYSPSAMKIAMAMKFCMANTRISHITGYHCRHPQFLQAQCQCSANAHQLSTYQALMRSLMLGAPHDVCRWPWESCG